MQSTSSRVRVIAVGTGTCSNAHRGANKRRPPAFLVSAGEAHILLDCGEGTRLALGEMGIDHRLITHVAVTHGHPDHSALPQWIQSAYCGDLFTRDEADRPAETGGLSIYLPRPLLLGCPERRIVPFMDVWRWHVPETPDFWLDFKPFLIPLDNGEAYPIVDNVRFTAFDVYHGFGKHPSMGFRVDTPWGSVGYTGDCGYTEDLAKRLAGVDLLIADCSTRVGDGYVGNYGHMDPAQCGMVARDAKVSTLWMTHWTGKDTEKDMTAAARRTEFSGKTVVAHDGLHWWSDPR